MHDRGWDGWMASLTQRTWVWANSRRWWKTGKPGMSQTMTKRLNNRDLWMPESTYTNNQLNHLTSWIKRRSEWGKRKCCSNTVHSQETGKQEDQEDSFPNRTHFQTLISRARSKGFCWDERWGGNAFGENVIGISRRIVNSCKIRKHDCTDSVRIDLWFSIATFNSSGVWGEKW